MDHLHAVPDDSPPGESTGTATDLAGLLTRSARGDEGAFAAVYDQVAARAYGLALQVVRDPAQSEEVVQEALLEVWRMSARFDPSRGTALSWIFTIVHRRAVDRVRAAESATRRDTTYHEHNRAVEHDTTAEAAQELMEAQRVRNALGTLTSVQREAIELAYLKGYTHSEIARMLDLPIGTAKTRIRDGLIRLRDTLGVGGAR